MNVNSPCLLRRLTAVLAVSPALLSTLSFAQQTPYPSRPIRAISGFPPGSSVDVVGRFITSRSVPPIAESVPGFEAVTWWAMTAPAGLPAPVLKRLNTEVAGILHQPESAQRLSAEGAEPWPLGSEAFTQVLRAELEKWTRVAGDIGLRAE